MRFSSRLGRTSVPGRAKTRNHLSQLRLPQQLTPQWVSPSGRAFEPAGSRPTYCDIELDGSLLRCCPLLLESESVHPLPDIGSVELVSL